MNSLSGVFYSPAHILNVQEGEWIIEPGQSVRYQLDMPNLRRDTLTVLIQLPYHWYASEEMRLGYIASGHKAGRLKVVDNRNEQENVNNVRVE